MRRILVIDDDKAVLTAMRTWLDMEGYEVIVADTGRKGVEALASVPFDVAIVDIFMPDMNGLETIRTFNRLAPGLPIIATSGFMFRDASEPAPDFLGMSTKLGAACCLQKPFRPRDLLNAIGLCLSGDRRSEAAASC